MNWEERIMKSKTSLFNKTIFRKDITRFWPLWALQLVAGLLVLIAPMMSELSYMSSIHAGTDEKMSFMVTLIKNSCLSPYTMSAGIVVDERAGCIYDPFISVYKNDSVCESLSCRSGNPARTAGYH